MGTILRLCLPSRKCRKGANFIALSSNEGKRQKGGRLGRMRTEPGGRKLCGMDVLNGKGWDLRGENGRPSWQATSNRPRPRLMLMLYVNVNSTRIGIATDVPSPWRALGEGLEACQKMAVSSGETNTFHSRAGAGNGACL